MVTRVSITYVLNEFRMRFYGLGRVMFTSLVLINITHYLEVFIRSTCIGSA
jgi:hypothetical protein